jgi:hypothetical protein
LATDAGNESGYQQPVARSACVVLYCGAVELRDASPPDLLTIGHRFHSEEHRELVRLVEVEFAWNQRVCLVWIPGRKSIERMLASRLTPLNHAQPGSLDRIVSTAAAACIADALTQDVLLAPLEAGIIPLPHQLHALTRAVTGDRVRYLLADEVGLGRSPVQAR